MSYNIRIIQCPECDRDTRVEPLLSGCGYSEWLCLDCGEVFKEIYPEEKEEKP